MERKLLHDEKNESIVKSNSETIKQTIDLLNSWTNPDQDKLFKATYTDSTVMVKKIIADLNKFLEESAATKNVFVINTAKLNAAKGKYEDFKEMMKYMIDKNSETHKNNLINGGNSLMDLASQYERIYQPDEIFDAFGKIINGYNSRVTLLTKYQTFDHPTIENYNLKNFLLGRETSSLRDYIRGIDVEHLNIKIHE